LIPIRPVLKSRKIDSGREKRRGKDGVFFPYRKGRKKKKKKALMKVGDEKKEEGMDVGFHCRKEKGKKKKKNDLTSDTCESWRKFKKEGEKGGDMGLSSFTGRGGEGKKKKAYINTGGCLSLTRREGRERSRGIGIKKEQRERHPSTRRCPNHVAMRVWKKKKEKSGPRPYSIPQRGEEEKKGGGRG